MTCTITKTQEAQPLGSYRQTLVDAKKAAADIRIVSCDGGYDIISQIALSGRGIKHRHGKTYTVTERALEKLQAQHSVMCDF